MSEAEKLLTDVSLKRECRADSPTCSECGNSYVGDYVDPTGHTNGEPVKENEVAATCKAAGGYDEVIYCTVCGDEISRLESLIESKETLIKKAIGSDSLMVGEKDGKLDFPWFKADAEPDEVIAYTHFVTALCRTAKEATRITGKDKWLLLCWPRYGLCRRCD